MIAPFAFSNSVLAVLRCARPSPDSPDALHRRDGCNFPGEDKQGIGGLSFCVEQSAHSKKERACEGARKIRIRPNVLDRRNYHSEAA